MLAAAQTDPVVAVTGGQIRGRMTSGGGAAFKAMDPDYRWGKTGISKGLGRADYCFRGVSTFPLPRSLRVNPTVLQPLYSSATICPPAFRSMSSWNRFGHTAMSI